MRAPAKAGKRDVGAFRRSLLAWYDRHRRVLPWRAGQGETPDPYNIWLSEIMLQQTVVAAVIPYFLKFVDKWPTVHDLAAASQDEVMEAWAGLGYYSRARNLHKCANIVATEHNGIFPADQSALKKLPGIGDYTSAAITAIAFGRPATVIDGNVDRVIARYFAITEPLPPGKAAIREHAGMLAEGRADRPGDFAQAMMDLGATICTPKSPKCMLCPLNDGCEGYAAGLHEQLPYKLEKAAKPQKYGFIYWVKNESGQVLFERRGEKGMLAGTLGLPVINWESEKALLSHPSPVAELGGIQETPAIIYHSFTHFDLKLTGYMIDYKGKNSFKQGPWLWVSQKDIQNLGLPTLFKKFVRLMLHDNGKAKKT